MVVLKKSIESDPIDLLGRQMVPEQQAHESIDSPLVAVGWHVCNTGSDK